MPSTRLLTLVTVAATCLIVTPAAAKPGPQTGTYKAKGAGGVSFRFTIQKAACPPGTPPTKMFYCFSGFDEPKPLMNCPDGPGYQPDYYDYVVLPYNVRIPKSGRFMEVSKGYYSNGVVASTSEFHVKIKRNGTATGWLRKEAPTTWGTPTTCSTGKLSFTAKRK